MIRKEGVTILMRLISPEKISSFFVQQDFYFYYSLRGDES